MRNSLLGTIDKELLLLTPPKKSGADPICPNLEVESV
jgi:hypothetical protein